MITDLFGKKRYKVNLHMHTTLSDGRKTPEEAIAQYRAAGYDALALTDHWHYGTKRYSDSGVLILPGAEYNIGGRYDPAGVFHILGIGAERAPSVTQSMSAQQIIDGIHRAGGMAVLAHPAWSLNTPEQILSLAGVDAIEVYNSVSGVHHSRRPDASLLVDLLGASHRYYPLLATDDTHYYDNDACVAFCMVQAEELSVNALTDAVRKGNFYASEGPEVHLLRDGDGYTVRCSPCREILFLSNSVFSHRVFTGEGLTEVHYVPQEEEFYLRAEVTDAEGRKAWTNILLPEQTEKGV